MLNLFNIFSTKSTVIANFQFLFHPTFESNHALPRARSEFGLMVEMVMTISTRNGQGVVDLRRLVLQVGIL